MNKKKSLGTVAETIIREVISRSFDDNYFSISFLVPHMGRVGWSSKEKRFWIPRGFGLEYLPESFLMTTLAVELGNGNVEIELRHDIDPRKNEILHHYGQDRIKIFEGEGNR